MRYNNEKLHELYIRQEAHIALLKEKEDALLKEKCTVFAKEICDAIIERLHGGCFLIEKGYKREFFIKMDIDCGDRYHLYNYDIMHEAYEKYLSSYMVSVHGNGQCKNFILKFTLSPKE